MNLKDKVVLVTGAGGGIGSAIVNRLIREGAVIVASDRSLDHLQDVIKTAERHHAKIYPLVADLAVKSDCDKLPQRAKEMGQKLDVLINNAGLMRRGNILDTTDEDWSLSMAVNVEAIFRLCRSAIRIMKSQGHGAIVNTASCWGIYPGPNHFAYCTTKAAIAAMTRCLGRDHAADGIRVNAVCPNEVNTPMLRTGFEIRGFDPAEAIGKLNKTVPLGHIAEPDEIADVIAFLASNESRYMCGALLEVNGGKPVY
ncbi:MAG: SDR family oxidoreductase [Gammaproteobacteria bacterium]|nr:SDR family oxidoreductase [Gammaproteobacteria bacterium]